MTQAIYDLLEQHFDTTFAAPDGIAKLRELILTLAMQGKLVEQDPNDPPANELLKEIETQKQRLVGEKKIKNPKPPEPIKAEEVPYDLPLGWEWVRLGNIGLVGSSSRVHQRDWVSEGVPFYRAREIVKLSNFDFVENKLFISEELYETLVKDGLTPEANDLMITGVGTIGVPYIVKETDRFYFKDASVLIFKNLYCLYAPFLFRFFKSPYWIARIHDGSMGTTVHTLTIGRANEILVPLPPIQEQRRIVAGIDQLMARCDELEKLRNDREENRLRIHASAIKQLLRAPGNTGWPFIQKHFSELYTVKENVAGLRKAILQLAFRGRLVHQDPNDPPASELLKEIDAEKQRSVAAKKIKKQKPLPPIRPEELPYELPQGWQWVRLGELFRVMSGKNLPKDKMQDGDIPVFGGNGITGYHNESNVDKSTIVIGRVGYYCGSIHLTPAKAWITDNAFFTIYDDERIFQGFVIWLLKTINLQVDTSATAQPVISGSKIYPILIPLPPLSEQQRIVARVDQLMALCDSLDQKIEAATTRQSNLLRAVMAQV